MADVGHTFSFDDIAIPPTVLPAGLPRFIPQVDGHNVASFDRQLSWPAYAVGLRRVFSPDTHHIYPRFADATAAQALSLRTGQMPVLVGYGEDPLVEAFWTYRHSRELIAALADQRWGLVLAPNFSLYGNQPRAEHLLNFRRNLLIAAELADAGVPAVPNLYWFRLEDLERYLAWAGTTDAAAVAVNLQTFRSQRDWDQMALPGLALLAAELPKACEVILTGTSRASRIAPLVALFGARLRIVSQNPQQYARHGAVMTERGREDLHADVTDAFTANVRYYAALLDNGITHPDSGGEPA